MIILLAVIYFGVIGANLFPKFVRQTRGKVRKMRTFSSGAQHVFILMDYAQRLALNFFKSFGFGFNAF